MSMENGNQPANLAAARKEQAAAREAAKAAHPAGTAVKKTAAKQTPAKTPAKEAPARKTPQRSGRPPLRWKAGVAVADGVTYSWSKSGDAFKATIKKGGKTTVIVDNASEGRCYQALVRAYHGEQPQGKSGNATA